MKEHNPALDRTTIDQAAKKNMLVRAKRALKDLTWLPEPLRTPTVRVQAPTAAIAAE
jgi:hypothetical protein